MILQDDSTPYAEVVRKQIWKNVTQGLSSKRRKQEQPQEILKVHPRIKPEAFELW